MEEIIQGKSSSNAFFQSEIEAVEVKHFSVSSRVEAPFVFLPCLRLCEIQLYLCVKCKTISLPDIYGLATPDLGKFSFVLFLFVREKNL